jgi:hypothetical protein
MVLLAGRAYEGVRTSSMTLHGLAALFKCVEIVYDEVVSEKMTTRRCVGKFALVQELGLRVVNHLEGASDLHTPHPCGIQDIRVRDAVSGCDRAEHEPGASYNIYCRIPQTTELEKDGWGYGHGEP